jgi:aminoglycoside phosphotransferase (APT) family kinase protein
MNAREALHYLLATDRVSLAELESGEIRLLTLSRRHAVFKVLYGDAVRFVLKHPKRNNPRDRSWIGREARFYKLLSQVRGTTDFIPLPIWYDEIGGVLLMSPRCGWPFGKVTPCLREQYAESLACVLTKIHTINTEPFLHEPEVASAPWIMLLPSRGDKAQVCAADPSGTLAEICSDEVLSNLLRNLASQWTTSSLVHGDMKLDNCILGPEAPAVSIVDWELWTVGNPEWDVGTAIQGLLVLEDQLGNPSALPTYAKVFCGAYREAMHFDSDMKESVVRHVAARCALHAYEGATAFPLNRSFVRRNLDLARELAGEVRRYAKEWF